MTGTGVIGGTVIMNYVMKNYRDKLPGMGATNTVSTRQFAAIAYSLLIPGIVGIVIRRYNRNISDGLIIGGLASAAVGALNVYAPDAADSLGIKSVSASPSGYPIRSLGAGFGSAPRGSGLGVLASASPFPSSNWGK